MLYVLCCSVGRYGNGVLRRSLALAGLKRSLMSRSGTEATRVRRLLTAGSSLKLGEECEDFHFACSILIVCKRAMGIGTMLAALAGMYPGECGDRRVLYILCLMDLELIPFLFREKKCTELYEIK